MTRNSDRVWQVDRLPGGHLGHEGVDHRGQGDVVDVHLVGVDQLQQQVDGTLEDGGGDGGGHANRPYRLERPISCTSGRRPTMTPHVPSSLRHPAQRRTPPGQLPGAIRNWVADQYVHDAFYCVVDLHALTLDIDPDELRSRTFETALDLLAAGLDPERCTLFVQSHVPEHTQMAWLLECTATMGELRPDDPVQGEERRARTRCGSGCSPIRCSRAPTSCSTTPTGCRWATTSASTSS